MRGEGGKPSVGVDCIAQVLFSAICCASVLTIWFLGLVNQLQYGAASTGTVGGGEPWRLFTAQFTHPGFIDILSNGFIQVPRGCTCMGRAVTMTMMMMLLLQCSNKGDVITGTGVCVCGCQITFFLYINPLNGDNRCALYCIVVEHFHSLASAGISIYCLGRPGFFVFISLEEFTAMYRVLS